MINVEEAKGIVMARSILLPAEEIAIDKAIGRYVAEDPRAPFDHPLFDMSAVDGYAFAFDASKERRVVGSIAAGEVFDRKLEAGECVRVFTGAMLPEGADTVVMQEYATTNEASMRYTDDKLKQGGNVRRTGEQFKRGDVIVPAGTHITEPVIGLLASAGMVRYKVSRQPTVYVVTTGGEFTSDQPPKPGKIFSSNDVMLHAALQRAGARVFTERTLDEATLLRASLEKAAAVGDVIITTGGASVGDHDLMRPVLEKLGAEIHFHGVSQKPGKPMLFATLSGKPVFALPGNPRAVMVLFWEYVLPFLRAMQGALRPQLKSDEFPIAHAVNVKGERAEFRAAQVKSGKVTLLADEGSHMLSSLIDADAIAYLPAGRRAWKEGEPIEVHYLPQ